MKKIFVKMKGSKWKSVCSVFLLLTIAIGIPIAINESYKGNKGYLTMWTAADVLNYYGNFLVLLGTITLGYIAVSQNKFIIETQTKSQCYSSYRLNKNSILQYRESDAIEFFPDSPKQSSEALTKNMFQFIFNDTGKAPAFKIQFIKFEIINYKNTNKKIQFYPRNNEYQILRNMNGNEGTQVGTNIVINYYSSLFDEIKIENGFMIQMEIMYLNAFNVKTLGKYNAFMKPNVTGKSIPKDFTAQYSTCDNESYSIDDGISK